MGSPAMRLAPSMQFLALIARTRAGALLLATLGWRTTSSLDLAPYNRIMGFAHCC